MLLVNSLGFACEDSSTFSYPKAKSSIHHKIDFLLDRGEKYLFASKPNSALKCFQQSKELFGQEDPIRKCRLLFDQAIAYALIEDEYHCIDCVDQLNEVLEDYHCNEAIENIYLAGNEPILGPDSISIEDCIERVEGTRNIAMLIISRAPISTSMKFSLESVLFLTEKKAKECCRMGGIWKACLQPIMQKWWDLKMWEQQLEKSFRVEPPCWD